MLDKLVDEYKVNPVFNTKQKLAVFFVMSQHNVNDIAVMLTTNSIRITLSSKSH